MFTHLKEYLYKTRWTTVLIAVITFLTHGSLLFTQRFGVDTDIIMQGMHNFNKIGRPALIWLSYLLDFEWFNLYYVQILTLLFLWLAPISIGFLIYHVGGQNQHCNITLLVLALSFLVSPFWVAQTYFMNQCTQIALSFILTAIAILFAEEARIGLRKRWYYLLISVVLMQFTFGSYQVLTVVYITTVAALFLISSLRKIQTVKEQLCWIGYHAVVFLAGFLIYMLIFKLFYSDLGNYLQNQVAWTDIGIGQGIQYCLYAIRDSLLCIAPYYTGLYGIFALLLLGATIYKFVKSGKLFTLQNILVFLVSLFLICTPYIFIFIQGGQIMDRLQIVLPLSQGCILYLIILLLYDGEQITQRSRLTAFGKVGTLLLIVLICKDTLTNLNYCSRLYYTDEWTFQYDCQIAEKLYYDIKEVQSGHEDDNFHDNVVFVGYPEIPYNDTCIRGDMIGVSYFQFEKAINTPENRRLVYFMRNLGYPVDVYYTGDELYVYDAYFVDYFGYAVDTMPSYPEPGYVQYVTNEEIGLEYLIIKLGDDWRYYE